MKVGRAALDEDAIRLIEELNPFVEFDWPRILKGQDAPPSEPRMPVEVRRPRREPRAQERREPRPTSAPVETPRAEVIEVADALHPDPTPAPQQPPPPDVIVAAHARIGAEGVARLRARHAEIVARIGERTTDPARREELQSQANRLSPDSWTSDADVARGLDEYETVLASLREVVGRKRRRRRRGGGGRSPENAPETADEETQTNAPADSSESREEPEDPGL